MIMAVYETNVAKTMNMIMAVHETINRPVKRKLPITPALLMRIRMCPNIDWSTPIIVVV
jgi:hypothetical protein